MQRLLFAGAVEVSAVPLRLLRVYSIKPNYEPQKQANVLDHLHQANIHPTNAIFNQVGNPIKLYRYFIFENGCLCVGCPLALCHSVISKSSHLQQFAAIHFSGC
jgi:hypothetical protein